MESNFSNYIVYVDESGDHGLTSIDPNYPVFVLVFCIFEKHSYLQTVNKIQAFKFSYFGHDSVILHESDIRRDKKAFRILKSQKLKTNFINSITDIIKDADFTVISAVIDKERLKQKYKNTNNPYHIALSFCLERIYEFLNDLKEIDKPTHIVFEQRGKNEDDELELEFRRVCNSNNYFNKDFPFVFVKAHKESNSTGLQFADLLARPIGLSILKPEQKNRAFEVVKEKLRKHNDKTNGYGLKIFP